MRHMQIPTLMLALAACGSATEAAATTDAVAEAPPEDVPMEERTFADLDVEECDMLTHDEVAELTGVPKAAIEQQSISGCIYTWDAEGGRNSGTIWVASVDAKKSVDRAKSWYGRHTTDESPEDIAEAKRQMKERLDEKAADGELTETEGAVAKTVTEAMPEEQYTYTHLDGVGHEAAVGNHGSLWARYGNVLIHVTAKDGDDDRMDVELGTGIGKAIVAKLAAM